MNQFMNLSHGRFGIALHASLLGCLAASDSLDTACSGFEATPVVDADHGENESRSRRRRSRCCGLWEEHKGNGVAPEGICQACRRRSLRRSQLVGRGAACSGQWAQRVGDQLVAEPDVWLQHRPQRTTRRTADGSRTAQIASHGRLTACRSRLMRYPDRADDRRASLFLRRGALCMLACVVQGISCA